MARQPVDLIERQHTVSGCARDLEHEEVAGDAAPFVQALLRRRGHVVGDRHALHRASGGSEFFRCHVEVHDVAGVVPVEEDDAGTAIDGPRSVQDLFRRW
jgi:hypothetical protein